MARREEVTGKLARYSCCEDVTFLDGERIRSEVLAAVDALRVYRLHDGEIRKNLNSLLYWSGQISDGDISDMGRWSLMDGCRHFSTHARKLITASEKFTGHALWLEETLLKIDENEKEV